MTDYYCDLGLDYADATGADAENCLRGVGGLQAACHGTGAATALVPGDTLLVKGTGNLGRLVHLTCGKDVETGGWQLGDELQNDTGDGDDWTGVLCELYGGGGTQILVELDAGLTIDDVDTADGIENVTQTDTTTLSAKACKGVEIDLNNGADGNTIRIVGVNAAWAEDGTQFVLDGQSKAASCITVEDKDYYFLRNCACRNAVADGITGATAGPQYWTFQRCESSNNGVCGWGFSGGFMFLRSVWDCCIADGNTEDGFRANMQLLVGCRAIGNTLRGVNGAYNTVMVGCVVHGNGGQGVYTTNEGSLLHQCVIDGNGGDGVYIKTGMALVSGCRVTNNTGDGIEAESATILAMDNVVLGNANATAGVTVHTTRNGAETMITAGAQGYADRDADLFNLVRGAAGYQIRVALDADGNVASFAAGLPTGPQIWRREL